MVNHILEMYDSDDIIAEIYSEIARLAKLLNMLSLEFADGIWLKTIGCPCSY